MNEITYSRNGDYLIPDLTLTEQPTQPLGEYGRMRKTYLEEHRKALFNHLLLSEKLQAHLLEIDQTANLQLTLFPTEQEQIQNIADRQERVKTQGQSAFSMTLGDMEQELLRGTGTQDGKLRVYDFYKKTPTEKAAVDFIKMNLGGMVTAILF